MVKGPKHSESLSSVNLSFSNSTIACGGNLITSLICGLEKVVGYRDME